jgi:large subunit ribosomal protein L21
VTYAVISIGNKQYRVREGEWLLVDRVPYDEGKTFHPDLVMVGGNGDPKFGSELKGQQVRAKVAEHVLGAKVVIGKHRRRTGYKRRRGFRARLTRIEIQSIGGAPAARPAAAGKKPATEKEAKPEARKTPARRAARKTGATAEKKAPARRSAPKRKKSEE